MHELTLYQKILESNVVNFIIMIASLVLIFKKLKLGAIFDKMANDIKTSVMTSADAAQAALKEYKEAKRSVKGLDIVKDEIKDKAKDTAKRMQEAFADKILKEKNVLDVQFENKVEADIFRAKEDSAKEFLDVVVELTKAEIQNRLNGENGAEIQSRLIDKCIKEVETADFSGVNI